MYFKKPSDPKNRLVTHVGIVNERVFDDEGNLAEYTFIHTSRSEGRAEVRVNLSNKGSKWNRWFVDFRTVDPKSDPLRPNTNIIEKAEYYIRQVFKPEKE